MEQAAKVYITGYIGMAGSSLERKFRNEEYNKI
jgi:hypothetical protein